MRRLRAAVLLTLMAASTSAGTHRARPVLRFVKPPPVENLLWIAAHPDDELLAAPALRLFCRDLGARCTIAVATRGERGTCELPSCGPDLGALREQELRASAALFAAAVVVGSFPDGSSWSPNEVLTVWNRSLPTLDSFLAALLEEIQPDLVLTLDPSHGSTCHPDHRAIGRAVIDASARRGVRAGALRTKAQIVGAWDSILLDPGLADADFVIDATRPSSDRGSPRWDALVDVARIHASQFPPRAIAALENVPPEQRLLGIKLLTAAPAVDRCTP